MKRLVILNVESSRLAGFTNRGVKVYATDIFTNEEVVVSIQKRPSTNQIALVKDSVIEMFGSPRDLEAWKNVIKWSKSLKLSNFEFLDTYFPRREFEAVTVDGDGTFYKSDAVTITQNGVIFHVNDFSNIKIAKLGRCSDFLSGREVVRCLPKSLLKQVNFTAGESRDTMSVNLSTKEIFRSRITITDSFNFEESGFTRDDITKWGRTFSQIVCESLGVEFMHDASRPLHSLAGLVLNSGQIDLLEKIKNNIEIEKTINFISEKLESFKLAVEKPTQDNFVNWCNSNPMRSINST